MPSGGKNTPAGQTVSTTSPFNALTMPFVQSGLDRASDLFKNNTPQYFPGATYQPLGELQTNSLNNIYNLANSDPIAGGAQRFDMGMLSGDYMNKNPAMPLFSGFAGENIGASNAGTNPLRYLSSGTPQLTNPGTQELGQLMSVNFGDARNPATPALSSYTSGSRVGKGNPYTDELVQSIMSRVVPSVQKGFIEGGTLGSPEAARSTAAGAMSAIAPSLFAQQQQEEANQMAAAEQVGRNYLTGAGLQGTEASNLGNIYQQGLNSEIQAANDLGLQAVAGRAEQRNAASGLSQAAETDMQQRLTALGYAPSTQQLPFYDQNQALTAGDRYQSEAQKSINDQVARWNYQQQLPYTQLDKYLAEIQGNTGTSSSVPFYQNPIANGLSTALGVGQVGNSLFGSGGLFGSGTSSGGGLFGSSGLLGGLFGGGGAALDAAGVAQTAAGLGAATGLDAGTLALIGLI